MKKLLILFTFLLSCAPLHAVEEEGKGSSCALVLKGKVSDPLDIVREKREKLAYKQYGKLLNDPAISKFEMVEVEPGRMGGFESPILIEIPSLKRLDLMIWSHRAWDSEVGLSDLLSDVRASMRRLENALQKIIATAPASIVKTSEGSALYLFTKRGQSGVFMRATNEPQRDFMDNMPDYSEPGFVAKIGKSIKRFGKSIVTSSKALPFYDYKVEVNDLEIESVSVNKDVIGETYSSDEISEMNALHEHLGDASPYRTGAPTGNPMAKDAYEVGELITIQLETPKASAKLFVGRFVNSSHLLVVIDKTDGTATFELLQFDSTWVISHARGAHFHPNTMGLSHNDKVIISHLGNTSVGYYEGYKNSREVFVSLLDLNRPISDEVSKVVVSPKSVFPEKAFPQAEGFIRIFEDGFSSNTSGIRIDIHERRIFGLYNVVNASTRWSDFRPQYGVRVRMTRPGQPPLQDNPFIFPRIYLDLLRAVVVGRPAYRNGFAFTVDYAQTPEGLMPALEIYSENENAAESFRSAWAVWPEFSNYRLRGYEIEIEPIEK